MATTVIDGISTHYEVLGSGPALLMFSPGGFDATIDKWRTQGIYTRLKLLDRDLAVSVIDMAALEAHRQWQRIEGAGGSHASASDGV